MTTRKQAPPAPSLFDLSSEGRLPALLRMLASQIEAGTAKADSFTWTLTIERLDFTARLDLKPHD